MAIAQKIRVQAEARERTMKILFVGAGGASNFWIGAGMLTSVGVITFITRVPIIIIIIIIIILMSIRVICWTINPISRPKIIVELNKNFNPRARKMLKHHLVRIV